MEWLDYMNASLDYIEKHLSIKMDIEEVAKKAGCSSYNFQRMFSFISNISLVAYIRRRCMTCAALDLANTDATVLDTALKYGYDSPVSFARAFHAVHGMNPQEAKLPGKNITLYPRISFHISIKGEKCMKYRIEQMGAFTLVGMSREISNANGENFKQVPQMWEDVCSDGSCERIQAVNGKKNDDLYGVCYDFNFKEEKFRYMVAVKLDGEADDTLEKLEVEPLTWAIFESENVAGIQDIFKRLYTEWFPTSGYQHADGPEIEYYMEESQEGEITKCEVWIPIMPIK